MSALEPYWQGGAHLNALRGRYAGPVILLASGPSAADFPLARYAHIPVIAMNGSILGCANAGVRPLFYLADDRGFIRLRRELVSQGLALAEYTGIGAKALGMMLEELPELLGRHPVLALPRANRPIGAKALSDRAYAWQARRDPDLECGFSLWRQKVNRIGFSRNLVKGYFGGRTIPYAALQLAYHLGFQHVFLVGVDLNAQSGRFYEQGSAALPSRLDEDFEDYILPSFRLMAERVLSPAFRVFNLSEVSRLPEALVPRASLAVLDAVLAQSQIPG